MPNRIIKDTIRTSKKVNALSDFQFRLWLYLITYVDDFGRGSADPELLNNLVFPRRKGITDAQISEALSYLANTGMVTLYEADGEPYFYFPNWGDHQRIRQKVSKYPEPPQSAATRGEMRLESNPIQYEYNPESESESNTNLRAREAEDDGFSEVMTFYMENISFNHPSSVVTAEIQGFVQDLSSDVVLHAMQIAAERDKHSWPYIKAILGRYRDSGLDTMEKVRLDEAREKAAKKGGAGGRGQAKSDNIFAELLKEGVFEDEPE